MSFNNIDMFKLQVQKRELGHGVFGTVFLGKIEDKQCAIKVEKFDGDMTTKSSFIRQIIFQNDMKGTDGLLNLDCSGIKEDCNFKQPIMPHVDKELKQVVKDKNKLDKCCYLAYTPILQHSLASVIDQLKPKLRINALQQIINVLISMNKQGYEHRDIHTGNIMCNENYKKWYLIDYGMVTHKKFIENANDKWVSTFYPDILQLIYSFNQSIVIDYINKNNKKFPSLDDFFKKFKKHLIFKDCIKYVNPSIKNPYLKLDYALAVLEILYPIQYAELLGITDASFLEFLKHYKNKNNIDPEILLYCIWNCQDLKKISTFLISKK